MKHYVLAFVGVHLSSLYAEVVDSAVLSSSHSTSAVEDTQYRQFSLPLLSLLCTCNTEYENRGT